MENRLHPKSAINVIINYADDTSFAVPENKDGEIIDNLGILGLHSRHETIK